MEPRTGGLGIDELSLATRNHGMPLEALRAELTPAGMHYVLTHYDVPFLDPSSWSLTIDGAVERPGTLSFDELASMPALTVPVTLECAGNGRAFLEPRPVSQPWLLEAVGTAAWTGVPLSSVLDLVGVADDAVDLVFIGADRGVEDGEEHDYERALPVAEARRDDVILAFRMNGEPLPPAHGFPLRLVVPGWYGMASVKWLTHIRAVTAPFDGYQNARAYRWRDEPDEPGVPMERIRVRSLIAPPGIPEFQPRVRRVRAGAVTLEGRAWSGAGEVFRVEVSTDDGATWDDATLEEPLGPRAWRRFAFEWNATPGRTVIVSRATDATGATQPLDPVWNAGGYGNNAVHRVEVLVEA
jgi:DMSO/TMAO reductase YedYZ molybdopterin-dependent catalytic subunit